MSEHGPEHDTRSNALSRGCGWAWHRQLAGVALTIALVVLVGLALLTAAMAVPNDRVVDQLVRAVDSGTIGPNYPPTGVGGFSNQWSECTGLTIGVEDPEQGRSALLRAIASPTLRRCDLTIESLRAITAGDPPQSASDYYRYWHGYAVATRPAVALVGVEGARLMAGALLASSLALLVAAMWRRVGLLAATALVLPLLVSTNLVAMHLEPTQAIPLAISLAGPAMVLTLGERGNWWLVVTAALAGGLLAFTDRLTSEVISLALTSFMAAVISSREGRSVSRTLGTMSVAASAWTAGYVGVWAAKWMLAVPVFGVPSVLDTVLDSAGFRVGGLPTTERTLGAALIENLAWWQGSIATAWLTVVLSGGVIIGAALVAVGRSHSGWWLRSAVLATPALLVPLRYELLSNHSQFHAHFTYRASAVALGIVVAAALVALRDRPRRHVANAGGGPHLPT